MIGELPSEGLVAGPDVATSFLEKFIDKIVEAVETVQTFDDFWKVHPFCSREEAQVVFEIVESIVGTCCQEETLNLADITAGQFSNNLLYVFMYKTSALFQIKYGITLSFVAKSQSLKMMPPSSLNCTAAQAGPGQANQYQMQISAALAFHHHQ